MDWLKAELEEMGIETEMIVRVGEEANVMEESVVELESRYEDPNHGRMYTPLLVPSTITKKGVELGLVIGLQPAVDIDDKLAVGGGTLTAKEKEDDIKYVAEW